MQGPAGFAPRIFRMLCAALLVTLRLLSEVVLLMEKGGIPEDARPWVCGAALMALRKPNGSLRPVVVGETLRGLCSKVCVDLMGSSSLHSILEPIQVGVQTRFGCEAVVHTPRQWVHTFLLIDLSNAFNCVSREAVLSNVRTHFPWLSPWADTCYRHDSKLLIGSSLISSLRRAARRPSRPVSFRIGTPPLRH